MSKGENELLSADFESGMLAGFADGLSLMHQILTDTAKATAPIRAADGLWYVAVMLYGGVELHPVDHLVRC